MNLYTAGYRGHTPAQLAANAKRLNALVMDIRYNNTWPPNHWCFNRLRDLLGERVLGFGLWGNRAYAKRDPQGNRVIEIADFDYGLKVFRLYYPCYPSCGYDAIILLCACEDAATCHRTVIARRLAEEGMVSTELDWTLEEECSGNS